MTDIIMYRDHKIVAKKKFWFIFPYWKAEVQIKDDKFEHTAVFKSNAVKNVKRLVDIIK